MSKKYIGKNRRVCVMGMGYIGLPTSALLASRGFFVHGVDVVQQVVDTINAGNIHIVEPGLEVFVREAVYSGKLVCSMEPTNADVFIIAVPTPFHDGHVPDVKYIKTAVKTIAPYIRKGNIIVLESTSPVGTTDDIAKQLQAEGVDTDDIFIAHCPERVLPGRIMREIVENDRIVGGITPKATTKVANFYREFVEGEVLETDAKTAEMTKLSENSYRDVNIAFANELSMLADKFGVDARKLIELANHHPRVNILKPGVGVGGHCIAVDPWFIIYKGGKDAKLMQAAREVNTRKTEWVVEKIEDRAKQLKSALKKKPTIACMGLAYKADIDDLRESPALEITKELISRGHDVLAVEPNLHEYKELELHDYKSAQNKADLIVLLVAHKEFKGITGENVIDFCGITREHK